MYKVLLVDDEMIIRQGLRVLIDWKSLGLELVAEAENGKSTLKLIQDFKPHILITDVKMPEMGGLELIKEINAMGLNIKTIIISGYDDFAYVKEALKYGVYDYILKPIRERDIASILKDVVRDIDHTIIRSINSSESEKLMRDNLFNRLINNSITTIDFIEKARFLNIDISDKPYRVMTVEIDGKSDLDGQELEYRRFSINNICEELFEKYSNIITFHDRSNRQVIITNDNEIDKNCIKLAAAEIRDCVKKFLDFSVTIGIGSSVESIMEISKSYGESVKALKEKFLCGKGSIIFYEASQNKYPVESGISLPDTEKIRHSVKLLNKESSIEEIKKYFKAIKKRGFSKASITQGCMDLFLILLSLVKEYGNKSIDGFQSEEEALGTIPSSETIEEIEETLIGFATKVIDYLSSIKGDKYERISSKVVKYVRENYSKNVTLKSVAKHFYLNTAYLGRIFKEETGELFSDFVNRVRVEEAGKMLVTSDYKIYEVAHRCGYKDIDYFRSTFKKVTGITPAEFKRRKQA
jgi:two-component system response regulator YesN